MTATNRRTRITDTDTGGTEVTDQPVTEKASATPTKGGKLKKTASKSSTYAHLTEEEAQRSADFARDLVPEPRYADEYVHRTIHGYHDFDVLDTARDLGVNVLLFGPTGSAKSHFFKAYGATHGLPVATVSCHGAADPALWFGSYRPLPGDDGATRWVWCDGVITTVLRHGGIIFLDEVNFLTGSIAASLHQVLRERELILLEKGNEVVKAAPDVLIVAAYNPGYSGTNELNEAFANRFALKLEWGYEEEVEAALLGANNELLALAADLRIACEEKRTLDTPCPTNALLEFADLAASFDTEFAIANFKARYRDDEVDVVQHHLDLLNIAAVDFSAVEDDEAEADADADTEEG